MMTVHVPELYCPVQTRIAPFVAQAEAQVYAWIRCFKLVDDDALERYRGERFIHMTARFYPGISLERLVILSKLYFLLFISDDKLDHIDNFKDGDYWKSFASEFMGVVAKGHFYNIEDGNPPLAALSSIWKEMTSLSTPEWREQFIASLYDMYKAAFWENDNISSGNPISLSQYMEKRQYLGAANVATDCIEFAYPGLRLSKKSKEDPVLRRITELARNTICWANDLFSLGKELEHGCIHNLVMLIQSEEGVSFKTALRRAVSIHDKEVQLFYTLWQDAISGDDSSSTQVNSYIEALASLMRGNIDWSVKDTNRYYYYSYAGNRRAKQPMRLVSH